MRASTERDGLPGLALVTGAASGIGFAVARALHGRGTRVALCDRNESRLAASARALADESGGEVRTFVLDVRQKRAVERTVAAIESEFGAIDALASVAGVLRLGSAIPAPEQGSPAAARALTEEDWNESFATNASGLFHLAQAVVSKMVARRRGAVVTVASNAASTPRLDMAAYAASKAAAVAFTKCLGLEVARYGIRCNVVSPGSTDTPMQHALWSKETGPSQVIVGSLERYRLGIPLGRMATAEDVAEVVVYLLSNRARQITLQDICVDGGATL